MSHMEPTNSSDDLGLSQDVPAVLRELQFRGMRFTKTPADPWSMRNDRVTLRKVLSVYFLSEVACAPVDILLALGQAGGNTGAVTSIQRRGSSRAWIISFATLADKEWALNVGSIDVCQTNVILVDASKDYTLVKIYDAPAELPDTAVIGRLSAYGQVVSFRRDRTEAGVENGSRTARVCLERVIPPSILVVGELIKIWYPKQPKLCRKCGASDHLARACNTPRCANCEAPGHQAWLCPEPPLCALCVSSGHSTIQCPFLLFSCNVEREDEAPTGPLDTPFAEGETKEESVDTSSAEESVEEESERMKEFVDISPAEESVDTSSAEESGEEEGERTNDFMDISPAEESVEWREAPENRRESVDISSEEEFVEEECERMKDISLVEENERTRESVEESERTKDIPLVDGFVERARTLLTSMRFDDVLNKKVDMEKVNLDVIKPWITKKLAEMLGCEDEVVTQYIFNMLESERNPDPKFMQINITGFLQSKDAREFMKRLWNLLVSAQENIATS